MGFGWLWHRPRAVPRAGLLLGVVFACAGADALAPAAERAILPVHQALQRVRVAQEQAGAPRDLAERLVRLGALDQAGREEMPSVDLSLLPEAERVPASEAMWREVNAQDAADQEALVALLPAEGWFTSDRVGEAALRAAWEVVQHATGNLALMRTVLGRMTAAVQARLVAPDDYGKLFDRVAMLEGRPQSYGTQFKCVDHAWRRYEMLEPEHVDERRRALGMSGTAEEAATRVAAYPPCYFGK